MGRFDISVSGSESCTLAGFVGVQMLADDGSYIDMQTSNDTAAAATTVTLSPGRAASFLLTWIGTCSHGAAVPARLELTPPGSHQYVSVPATAEDGNRMTVCFGGFGEEPITAA